MSHHSQHLSAEQSPRCCNETLDTYLKDIGFLQSVGDPCVYSYCCIGRNASDCVCVDDIVVACKSDDWLMQIKRDLCRRFVVKDFIISLAFELLRTAKVETFGSVNRCSWRKC